MTAKLLKTLRTDLLRLELWEAPRSFVVLAHPGAAVGSKRSRLDVLETVEAQLEDLMAQVREAMKADG